MIKKFFQRKPEPRVEETQWFKEMFPDPIDTYAPVYGQFIGRADDAAFATARSWFGGMPRLGTMPWPRASQGMAMTHIASVDLADIHSDAQGLPNHGVLAFFLAMGDGPDALEVAVKHVAVPGPTKRPDDLPAVSPVAGGSRSWPAPFHVDTRTMVHYPLQFTTQEPRGAHPFDPPQAVYLSAARIAHLLPNGSDPWLWDSAQRLVTSLMRSPEALDKGTQSARDMLATYRARLEDAQDADIQAPTQQTAGEVNHIKRLVAEYVAELATLVHLRKDYTELCAQATEWVQGKDPWSPMPQEAVEGLRKIIKSYAHDPETKRYGAFEAIHRLGLGRKYRSLADVTTDTLFAMSVAAPEVFRKLPPQVQRLVILRDDHAQTRASLQMFGVGHEVQDAIELNCDKHMLMQFNGAEALGLAHGSIKVWIAAEDLAVGAFEKAGVTYEYD